jgi:hypothetical protein
MNDRPASPSTRSMASFGTDCRRTVPTEVVRLVIPSLWQCVRYGDRLLPDMRPFSKAISLLSGMALLAPRQAFWLRRFVQGVLPLDCGLAREWRWPPALLLSFRRP